MDNIFHGVVENAIQMLNVLSAPCINASTTHDKTKDKQLIHYRYTETLVSKTKIENNPRQSCCIYCKHNLSNNLDFDVWILRVGHYHITIAPSCNLGA